jgi:hypothetical protein
MHELHEGALRVAEEGDIDDCAEDGDGSQKRKYAFDPRVQIKRLSQFGDYTSCGVPASAR